MSTTFGLHSSIGTSNEHGNSIRGKIKIKNSQKSRTSGRSCVAPRRQFLKTIPLSTAYGPWTNHGLFSSL